MHLPIWPVQPSSAKLAQEHQSVTCLAVHHPIELRLSAVTPRVCYYKSGTTGPYTPACVVAAMPVAVLHMVFICAHSDNMWRKADLTTWWVPIAADKTQMPLFTIHVSYPQPNCAVFDIPHSASHSVLESRHRTFRQRQPATSGMPVPGLWTLACA